MQVEGITFQESEFNAAPIHYYQITRLVEVEGHGTHFS